MRKNSKFLSRPAPSRPVHPSSALLLPSWQWLQSLSVRNDETGEAVRLMRRRRDPPRGFPNKRRLHEFMILCNIDDDMIERQLDRLWDLWLYWQNEARHDPAAPIVKPDYYAKIRRPVRKTKWLSR